MVPCNVIVNFDLVRLYQMSTMGFLVKFCKIRLNRSSGFDLYSSVNFFIVFQNQVFKVGRFFSRKTWHLETLFSHVVFAVFSSIWPHVKDLSIGLKVIPSGDAHVLSREKHVI